MILASLNLHGGRRADGTPFDVAAACRQLQAYMVVLQEAGGPAGRPDPVAEAARALGHRILRADLAADTDLRRLGIAADAGRGQWGLAVLTALPVTGYEVADLGPTPGEKMRRTAQLVTVTTPEGTSLRVVNTHLTYRFLSPVQLVRLTRRLAAETTPTVIVGDLNMPAPVSGLAVGPRAGCR